MPPPRKRMTRPESNSKNSSMGLILGGVTLLVIIAGYFIYSSWEKGKYINETLAMQTSFSAQSEKGEFQKCLTTANVIQNRINTRSKIFSLEQKSAFAEALKSLKRQVELKEIFEKINLETTGESSKSLTKISQIRKELNGKIILHKSEMNPFITTMATGFQKNIFEQQKELFRTEFRKSEKDWEKLVVEGKFIEAAKQFNEYITASKDPKDSELNAFIDKAFPVASNKFEIQKKIYEEALAIYKKGIEGSDLEYTTSINTFDLFLQKTPLDYPELKNELKSKLVQLKGAQRSRYRLRMNSLPLEKSTEIAELEAKAFALEMPTAAKIIYAKTSKQDLEKLTAFLKTNLPFFNMDKESINEAENNVLLHGKEYTVESGFVDSNNTKYFVAVINGVRLWYGANLVSDANLRQNPNYGKYVLNHAYEIARKIKLIDEACEMPEQYWNMSLLSNLGLGLFAETKVNGTSYFLMNDKLFKVDKQNFDRKEAGVLIEKFRALVKDLGSAISNNPLIEKEVALPMNLLVSAISERIDGKHFLTIPFAQLALMNDYVEKTIPNCPSDIKEKAKKLKDYFIENISNPKNALEGKSIDGSETFIASSLSGFNTRWVYDKERDETSFIRLPAVIELDHPMNFSSKTSFAVIYKGRHEKDPSNDPIRLEAQHLTGGVLAVYDYPNKKFYVDEKNWNRHIITVFKMPELYGTADWYCPPHILNIDVEGNIKEMFVPNGRFALKDFSAIKDEEEKLKSKEEWLNATASVLKSIGELHLLFKYFSKYTYDSPVPNLNNLIGNNNERGDFHQTVYQTIERNLGSKMLCDCDDLAEVYADLTRRQGRISYVMSVPGHATCGWIEKLPDGYAMNFLDTGPPRRIIDKNLDVAIEKGVKSYDQSNLVGFNARNVAFLFRFAGEQVRQGYYLDSKVMVDNEYGCAMVDVQESWHFHFFLQGVETMEDILKNDKSAANYFELSGLYREMGVYDQAVKIYKLGLDQLDKKDEFGIIQSNMAYIAYNQKINPTHAQELLKQNIELLNKSNAPAKSKELVEFDMANNYIANKKIIEAFKLIEKYLGGNSSSLNERFIITPTSILSLLNEKVRENQPITEEEKNIINKLDLSIKKYYELHHFKAQDDNNGSIQKYNGIFSYFIAKYGWDVCFKKLNEGRYPKNISKNHLNRSKTTEEEDWDWVRLNIFSSYTAVFQSLSDKKDKTDENEDKSLKALPTPEKWKEAMKYIDLMEQTFLVHKENGLGKQNEDIMHLARMLRGVVEKNDKLVDATLDKMKNDDWTRFYRMVSDSIAGMCELVPKEDFIKLFIKFSERNPPKQHYFGIAYKAFLKKKYDIAIAVGELAAKKFKDDPKMSKELTLLKAFVAKQSVKK